MRVLLVVNSFASSVTARNTVIVHRRLARGHDVEVVETNRRGHATRFAHDAARRGVDVVIGYGGDDLAGRGGRACRPGGVRVQRGVVDA